jgi:3-aminobutyryl-CoA ammonia-lyase
LEKHTPCRHIGPNIIQKYIEGVILMRRAMIRVRMSEHDAHYGGGLVNGARVLDLFGDVATELSIWSDGDEGLFRTYEHVDFLAPIYAGDYLEVTGWYTRIGNTSRQYDLEAWKVAQAIKDAEFPSAAEVIKEPILVARATGIGVCPKECQRGPQIPMEELLDK